MSSPVVLAILLSAAPPQPSKKAPEFSFSLNSSSDGTRSRELDEQTLKTYGAVEKCVGALPGPVFILLFVGHKGLFVDVRAAPPAEKACLEQTMAGLDISKTELHETTIVEAGNDVGAQQPRFESNSLEVYDRDSPTPKLDDLFAGKPRPSDAALDEVRAHMPLLRRCSPGRFTPSLRVTAEGVVEAVQNLKNPCITEVLKGLRLAGPRQVNLQLVLE
jgi:hypothetical protein